MYLVYLRWVKSVRVRSYSSPHFPAFGLHMEKYSVSLSIQSDCGKIRTRITPNMDTFHAVLAACHVCLYIWFEKKLQINQQLVTLFHLLINNSHTFSSFSVLFHQKWYGSTSYVTSSQTTPVQDLRKLRIFRKVLRLDAGHMTEYIFQKQKLIIAVRNWKRGY